MPRVRILVVVLCALLAVPAAAQAKNLYVSGAGTASDSCLDAASACTLTKAVGLAVNGDTVIVSGASGPVTPADTVTSNAAIAIRSTDPSAAKPVVTGLPSAGGPLLDLGGAGASISGLDIRNTAPAGTAGSAVQLRGTGAILQDSIVTSAGFAVQSTQSAPILRRVILHGGDGGADLAASGTDPAVITNSLITTDGTDSAGLINQNVGEVKAVNVTIRATGVNAVGAFAFAASTPSVAGSEITLRNAIVRGTAKDVVAEAAAGCIPTACADGVLNVDHSDFVTKDGPVTEGTGNVSVDPGFVSATDFHLAATSALRDIGVDDALSQPVDLAGSPRKDGTGVDLGAYEFLIPLPPLHPLPPADAVVVPKDETPPTLGVVRLSNARFRVGPKATALSAARRRSARRTAVGTTVTTGVTERSTILFEIDRIITGRKSAGDCVKVKAKVLRRLKASRKCKLTLPVEPGLERVAARPGRVSFDFSGRVGTVALPAGPYNMIVIATDAAGNRSAPQRASFTILPPKKAAKKQTRR